MTCQELIGFLTEYLDGQLPLSQRLAFELHLSLCRDCRAYLHNFKVTIAVGKSAFSGPDDDTFATQVPEELVQAILSARRQ